jgi:hypothetical protein
MGARNTRGPHRAYHCLPPPSTPVAGRRPGARAMAFGLGRAARSGYRRAGTCWSAQVLPSGSLKVTNEPHG